MYYYSNDKFSLMFYDANNNLVFETQNIYSNSYTLSQDEWNQVLSSIGSYYYVVIKSYSTLGSETGPYYSQKYRFNIPSSSNKIINNVDYNDDEHAGIRNAKLTNYYDSSITYLIVFCQFNPSNIFDNLDTGDDIVVRISKNS